MTLSWLEHLETESRNDELPVLSFSIKDIFLHCYISVTEEVFQSRPPEHKYANTYN